MSLITCPECHGQVSDSAPRCPHCGYEFDATRSAGSFTPATPPPPAPQKRSGSTLPPLVIVAIVVLVVILGALLAMLFGRGGDKGSSATEDSQRQESVHSQAGNTSRTTESTSKSVDFREGAVYMTGTLGGDRNAWIRLDNGVGKYHFINYERSVHVDVYDPSSGRLILQAYSLNGNEYIGEFKGKVTSTAGGYSYSGTFTNNKQVSINFDFHD